VNVPPSVFHFVLFFVFVRALPLPTNYLKMIVAVVPVSSRALIGTTVPSHIEFTTTNRSRSCLIRYRVFPVKTPAFMLTVLIRYTVYRIIVYLSRVLAPPST
jgi:hypothetical protein